MNILSISANDNGLGGASRIAMDLHNAYAAAGHQVSMLTGKKTSHVQEVVELRRPPWRKAMSYLLANDFDFFDGRQVLESRQFRQADIVHCHNLNGWYFNLPILAEMTKLKPVVWTLHDMWAITPHSAYTDSRERQNGLLALSDPSLYPSILWNNARHLARRKSQIYAQMSANIVTPCRWLAELVSQTALASQPLSVIYNGIDLSPFRLEDRTAAKSRLGLGEGPMVLFVGASATTNQFKGYVDFEWLANSGIGPPVQFVCLGAPEDTQRSGLRLVRATSDRHRIASFMSAADVLVVPSRHEVLPTVIIEAMACGTPIVGYDVGGISEMLAGAQGSVVVPALERHRLREEVRRVIARPDDEQRQISTGLRRHAEMTYGLDRMVGEYLNRFEELLGERMGRAR